MPRDREGQFHSQVFERFARYEPQVEEGLRDMFVAGVSTAKVGEVAEQLIGVAPSKSAVSRLNADLEDSVQGVASPPPQRPLADLLPGRDLLRCSPRRTSRPDGSAGGPGRRSKR